MRKPIAVAKHFYCFIFVVLVAILSIQSIAAQCGTFFKTKYQKPVDSRDSLQVEDWTGDGKADFWRFALNPATNRQNLLIYPNNGNGEFDWNNPVISPTPLQSVGGGSPFSPYQIADFNSDGKKDVLFSEFATRTHTIYLNNGNNAFTVLASSFFDDEPNNVYRKSLGFIDTNGDNILDWVRLIYDDTRGYAVNYRLGSISGVFGAKTEIFYAGFYFGSSFEKVADFTGDGKKDIYYSYPSVARLLINNGNGTFTAASAPVFPSDSQVADFNSDGKSGFVRIYLDNASVPQRHLIVYKSNGNGTFTETEFRVFQANSNQPSVNNLTNIKIADFNGDALPDIIELGGSFYSVHLNNGSGGFSRTDYKTVPLGEDLIFANFNADNKTDILVSAFSSIYLHNAFNERIILIKYSQCESFGETKRNNFDETVASEIVRWNPNTGVWHYVNGIWSNNGNITPKTFSWGTSSDIAAPGDYDGDGKTDFAVFRPGNGTWYVNQSANSSVLTFQFGTNGDIAVPNDYDGGGKTDFAVFRPSNSIWYIWSTETQQFSAVKFGTNGDKPVASDYDGDGKTDVPFYRPSEGNWYYLRSSDQNFAAVNWGISTDKPVPADYDGDGRSDIAVFREGFWYILRSSNNSFSAIKWGTSGDIPIPFYQNGESAMLVVYRPSNFVWYIYDYRDRNSALFFGDSQTVPIYFGLPNN